MGDEEDEEDNDQDVEEDEEWRTGGYAEQGEGGQVGR